MGLTSYKKISNTNKAKIKNEKFYSSSVFGVTPHGAVGTAVIIVMVVMVLVIIED